MNALIKLILPLLKEYGVKLVYAAVFAAIRAHKDEEAKAAPPAAPPPVGDK